MERVNGLKTGDAVEVEFAPGASRGSVTLTDIDTYREPQVGEFVKLDTLKVGTRSVPAIVLNVVDEPQTFALPGTGSDASVVATARKLKPGNYVRFVARDDSGHATLRGLRIDGHMEPTPNGGHDFMGTFIRIHFYDYGAETDVYFYPRAGRPDDQLVEKGLRMALWNTSDTSRLELKPEQVEKLRKILTTRLESNMTEDQRVREKMQWVKAYQAWQNARDEAERNRIEEQMAFAAQDVSAQWKNDVEGKFVLLKSLLDGKQLDAVRELGRKSNFALE
jgi:hypothetical protein